MPKLSRDEKWKRFNKKLEKLMKENNLWGLATTYYEMASFLEEEGKDNKRLRDLGYQIKLKLNNNDLKRFKETDKVEIITCGKDSCDACRKLENKVFSVKEVKEKKILPVEECVHKYGCRCCYAPHIEI